MPGGGQVAVVLLWIMVGFGVLSGIGLGVALAIVLGPVGTISDGLWQDVHPEAAALAPITAIHIVRIAVWTVLRAVFAARIPRRIRWARSGAIRLEVIGFVLNAIALVMVALIIYSGEMGMEIPNAIRGSLLELALPIIVVALLAGKDMRRWCDQ